MAEVLAAVDLTTVLATITPVLVIAIGIAMAFKGAGLGKRAIKTA